MNRSIFLLLWGAAGLAQATDGVFEINQALIDGAGGGPLVISQPGSYRLTSNLRQPLDTQAVIQISSDSVVIDLNGFTIAGTTTCTNSSSSVQCTAPTSGAGAGITDGGSYRQGIVIRNGNLAGIAGWGISLVAGVVDHVQVYYCGGSGIGAGRVTNSLVAVCKFTGISAVTVEGSRVESNGGRGIVANDVHRVLAENNLGNGIEAAWVKDSRSSNNHGDGVFLVQGGSVQGSLLENNQGMALRVINGVALSTLNRFSGNVGGDFDAAKVLSTPLNSNLCGAARC